MMKSCAAFSLNFRPGVALPCALALALSCSSNGQASHDASSATPDTDPGADVTMDGGVDSAMTADVFTAADAPVAVDSAVDIATGFVDMGASTWQPEAGQLDGSPVTYPTSCDDIGSEPTIPPLCASVLATKTVAMGAATADADETSLDTAAIQTALDACPPGQSLRLATDGTKTAFLVGTIQIRSGKTLWIDAGVTVYASRNPRNFDAKPGSGLCGTTASNSACSGVFTMSASANAGVMGKGTVDGQGGKPVLGSTSTWWQLNDAANGGLAAPRLVSANAGSGLVIQGLRFQNGGKFHIVPAGVQGFTIWGVTIITDPTSPNTDGIDPAGSADGVIAYCNISTGDDNIAIKGAGPMVVNNLIIAHNHFGKGHGMSIGSETNVGVKNVKVCDLSLDGTSNGIRIKSDISRGGLVTGISYTDVCMRNVSAPLVFNPFYTSGATGTSIPSFQNIVLSNVHVLGGGKVTLNGYDASNLLTLAMDNVVFDSAPTVTASQAAITVGPDPVSIAPSGAGVTVGGAVTGTAPPRDCSNVWVAFD
jgi:polygalacturonase